MNVIIIITILMFMYISTYLQSLCDNCIICFTNRGNCYFKGWLPLAPLSQLTENRSVCMYVCTYEWNCNYSFSLIMMLVESSRVLPRKTRKEKLLEAQILTGLSGLPTPKNYRTFFFNSSTIKSAAPMVRCYTTLCSRYSTANISTLLSKNLIEMML